MATTLRTSVNPILSAIVAQLVTSVPIPTERVIITTWDHIPSFQADQDIVIHVGSASPEGGMAPTGRFWSYLRRLIAVRVRSRFAVDLSYQDVSKLTDTNLGLFTLEETVLSALQDFQPTDINNNSLVIEPLRYFTEGPDPVKEPADVTWVSSVLPFSILYAYNFSNPTLTVP